MLAASLCISPAAGIFAADGDTAVTDTETAQTEAASPSPSPTPEITDRTDTVTVTVNASEEHQTIKGVGGAITYYINNLVGNPYKDEVFDLLFGEVGLDVIRIMNRYGYENEDFSENVAQVREVIDSAEKAAGKDLTVFMTSWSPAGVVKSNGSKSGGEQTDDSGNEIGEKATIKKDDSGNYMYDEYGAHYADMIKAYRKKGVWVDYFSIQNEPDWWVGYEGCLLTPTESPEFAQYSEAFDATYEAMQSEVANPPVLIGPETLSINLDGIRDRIAPILDKEGYDGRLGAIAHHLYAGSEDNPDEYVEKMRALNEAYPKIPKWETEYPYGNGVQTAWLLTNAFVEEEVEAYLYWDLIYDINGTLVGMELPWTSGDWKDGYHGYKVNDKIHGLTHFARFTDKDYKRVGTSVPTDAADIKLAAFKSPDNDKLSIILTNTQYQNTNVKLDLSGFSYGYSEVYRTNYQGSDERVKNIGSLSGDMTVSLPAQSIVTVSLGTAAAPDPTRTPYVSEPTPSPNPYDETQLINNSDFEGVDSASNRPGWWDNTKVSDNAANAAIESSTDAYSGKYSVCVSNRTSASAGIFQYFDNSKLKENADYEAKAYVKYTDANAPDTVTFKLIFGNKWGNSPVEMAKATVKKGEWTEIKGTFTTPEKNEDDDYFGIYTVVTEEEDGFVDYCLDDFTVTSRGTLAKSVGSSNPLISHDYGADPSAMEYGGRLYVYMSTDEYEYDSDGNLKDNEYKNLTGVKIISTDDMVNWTDHGKIQVAGEGGAVPDADGSWAPAIAHKTIDGKEKFFLYYANVTYSIGVLEADSPTGPFVYKGTIVNGETAGIGEGVLIMDPAVLVDDDKTGYLYFGGGVPKIDGVAQTDHPNTIRVIRLGDDMISTVGSAVTIDAPGAFEDSGIHKHNGKYYYSYCTNFDTGIIDQAAIHYLISDSPMGPFKSPVPDQPAGKVLDDTYSMFGIGGNNHHAIFEYKGREYITYHARTLEKALRGAFPSVGGYRSPHINAVEYDGDLLLISRGDYKGIAQLKPLNPYLKIEAETIAWSSGVKTAPIEPPAAGASANMKLTDLQPGDWTSVAQADFGNKGTTSFCAAVNSSVNGAIEIRLDSPDGTTAGTLDVAPTDGEYKELTCAVSTITGTHDVYFVFKGEDETLFDVDSWSFAASEPGCRNTVLTKISKDATSDSSEATAVLSEISPNGFTISRIDWSMPYNGKTLSAEYANTISGNSTVTFALILPVLLDADAGSEAADITVAFGSAEAGSAAID